MILEPSLRPATYLSSNTGGTFSPKAGNKAPPWTRPGRMKSHFNYYYTTPATALPTAGSAPHYARTACSDRSGLRQGGLSPNDFGTGRQRRHASAWSRHW